MRHQNKEYLERFLNKHPEIHGVLEVGSLDVNGSVRDIFASGTYGDYLGLDMRDGKNVDIVLNAHDIPTRWTTPTFDLVICFDTLEHDDKFWVTVENMRNIVKEGGWLFVSAPSGACPEHDHPHDYWRFMPQSFNLFFEGFKNVEILKDRDNQNQKVDDEIIGWGQK